VCDEHVLLSTGCCVGASVCIVIGDSVVVPALDESFIALTVIRHAPYAMAVGRIRILYYYYV
jgi:hypothetical protein